MTLRRMGFPGDKPNPAGIHFGGSAALDTPAGYPLPQSRFPPADTYRLNRVPFLLMDFINTLPIFILANKPGDVHCGELFLKIVYRAMNGDQIICIDGDAIALSSPTVGEPINRVHIKNEPSILFNARLTPEKVSLRSISSSM